MAKARRKTPGVEVTDRANDVGAAAGSALATAPQNVGDTTAAAADRDRIARRAYELYLAREGRDGDAMDDWLAAERELGQDPRKT